MKRRIVCRGVKIFAPLVVVEWVHGNIMDFQRATTCDDVLLDGLIAMWTGGVQVSGPGVVSRFK